VTLPPRGAVRCLPLLDWAHLALQQVIILNRSLSLPKGKLAAQAAHAAVGAFVAASAQAQMAWLQVGMPKITV
jgi:peptidyl-tRNA hydrolase